MTVEMPTPEQVARTRHPHPLERWLSEVVFRAGEIATIAVAVLVSVLVTPWAMVAAAGVCAYLAVSITGDALRRVEYRRRRDMRRAMRATRQDREVPA